MSLSNTGRLRTAPEGASAVSVTAGGSAWTFGNWAQVHSGVLGEATIAGLFMEGPYSANRSFDVDFGIGIPGFEQSIGSPIRVQLTNQTPGNFSYMLPTPLKGMVPAGAAVAVRIRCNQASTAALIGLHYYLDYDADTASTLWKTKAAPEAANIVSVTPSATPWAAGAYAVLTTGLAFDAYVYGIAYTSGGVAPNDVEIDLGTGGAGSEVVGQIVTIEVSAKGAKLTYRHLPALWKIPSGTRIAARVRQSGTSTNVFGMSLLYLEGTPTTAPPTPANDYPCGIVTPEFWTTCYVGGSSINSATRPLRDPSTYYGGYKPPRLQDPGQIALSASDWLSGAWQAQTARMSLIDHPATLRNLPQTSMIGGSGHWYMVSSASRIALGDPALLFQGRIVSDDLAENRGYVVEANDYLSADYDLLREDKLIPQRIIGDDFPNAPFSNQKLGTPLILGEVSDEGAATPYGQVKLINIGDLVFGGVTYGAALVCLGAAFQVINVYQENAVLLTAYGTDVWAPGHASWTSIVPSNAPYVQVNGNYYTLVLVRNTVRTDFQSGAKPLYANVRGYDPASADAPATYESHLLKQYKHAFEQFFIQNYGGGPWLAQRTFPFWPGNPGTVLPVADAASWDTAHTVSATVQSGGFLGGVVIGANGERKSVRQHIQEANTSCGNLWMGINDKGQIFVTMLGVSRSGLLGSARTITKNDIYMAPGLSASNRKDWFTNWIDYSFKPNYRGFNPEGLGSSSESMQFFHWQFDSGSMARHGLNRTKQEYPWVRDEQTGDFVAGQRLRFAGTRPPRMVTWTQSLCGMGTTLLSGVPITHFNLPVAQTAVLVLNRMLDTANCRVTFTGVDVQNLVS